MHEDSLNCLSLRNDSDFCIGSGSSHHAIEDHIYVWFTRREKQGEGREGFHSILEFPF